MSATATPEKQWRFMLAADYQAETDDKRGHLAAGPIERLLGQELLDTWLPQFGVSTSDAARMDNRTKLRALGEGMLREVSGDTRFSNADRAAIEDILPKAGVRESYEKTIQTAATLENIFAKRALINSQNLGRHSPVWAIAALDKAKVMEAAEAGIIDETGLLDAIKLRKLTEEQAVAIMAKRMAGKAR